MMRPRQLSVAEPTPMATWRTLPLGLGERLVRKSSSAARGRGGGVGAEREWKADAGFPGRLQTARIRHQLIEGRGCPGAGTAIKGETGPPVQFDIIVKLCVG